MHQHAAASAAATANVAVELVSCSVLVTLPEAAAQETCATACSSWAAAAGLVPTQGAGLGPGAAPEGAYGGGGGLAARKAQQLEGPEGRGRAARTVEADSIGGGAGDGYVGLAVCGSAHVLSGVVRLRTWVQAPSRTRPRGAASSGRGQQGNDKVRLRTQPREQQEAGEEQQQQRRAMHAAIVMRNVTILCGAVATEQPGYLDQALATAVAVPDLHPHSNGGPAASTSSVVHAVEKDSRHTSHGGMDPQPQPQQQPHPRAGQLSGATSILKSAGKGAAAAAAAAPTGLVSTEKPGLPAKAATHGGAAAESGAAVHSARQLTSTLGPARGSGGATGAAASGGARGSAAGRQPDGARHAAASRGVSNDAANPVQAALAAGASLLVLSVALGGCLWWRGLGRRKAPDAAAVRDGARAGASVGVALGTTISAGAASAAPVSGEAREVGPDGGVPAPTAGGLCEEFSLRPGGAKAVPASAAGRGGDAAAQVQALGPAGVEVGPSLALPHPRAHSGPPGGGLLLANTLSTDMAAPSRYGSGLDAPGESFQDGRRLSSHGQVQRAVLHDPLQFELGLTPGLNFPRIVPASDLAHDRCGRVRGGRVTPRCVCGGIGGRCVLVNAQHGRKGACTWSVSSLWGTVRVQAVCTAGRYGQASQLVVLYKRTWATMLDWPCA